MQYQHKSICKNTVVTLSYVMFDDDSGKILEYRDDMHFLHGGNEELLPKLHEAVNGYNVGMCCDVLLTEDEAFGPYDPELIVKDIIHNFPSTDIDIGSTIEGRTESGEVLLFRVTDVDGDVVTVDANHPLAGVNLRFSIEVREIRDATLGEIEMGRAYKLTSSKPTRQENYH